MEALPELPPMPLIAMEDCIAYDAIRYVPGYTVDYVRQFATEYARQAVMQERAAERERCAKLCEEVNATTGECPELALYCAAAIRSQK